VGSVATTKFTNSPIDSAPNFQALAATPMATV
jgi:hypothetical protein